MEAFGKKKELRQGSLASFLVTGKECRGVNMVSFESPCVVWYMEELLRAETVSSRFRILPHTLEKPWIG